MVTLNPQTQVITKSIRYTVAGTKPGTAWTVSVDPVDGAMTCDCPDATYRNRQCKHQRAVIAGAAGRPIVRISQCPPLRSLPPPAAYRDTLADADLADGYWPDLNEPADQRPPLRCRTSAAGQAFAAAMEL